MAKKLEFNPVKEDETGKIARRAVWSTKAIELAIQGLLHGKRLVANPFYDNKINLLKADLLFQRTDEEIFEWNKCASDILYFAEKYCKLLTPEGIKNIKLRDYQKRYLKHLENNRLSIYLACRQCAKTTTSAIFLLWYIVFNVDKNALVLGNKRKTACEILSKTKKIYEGLPYFLKPGIEKWNEGEIVLDNGCMIMAEATTINSGISFTFHCVLADEFAHIKPSIMEPFYNNLFPVVTAGKSRFMITSTQNGYNLFYRLYKAAEAGDNDYKAFKTDWWEVPEWDPENRVWTKRDEEWHQHQVANYGSEEAFNKQFGTNFDIAAKTLINQKKLNKNQQDLVEFVEKDLPGVMYSEFFKWHPDFEPTSQLRNTYCVITADLAEGEEGDYTVFSIYRLIKVPGSLCELEKIGKFKSNTLVREQFTLAIMQLICLYGNSEKMLLSWERNTYGELFEQEMYKYVGSTNFSFGDTFDPSIFVKYFNDTGTKYKFGVKITPGNKTPHCLLYKEDYERGKIIDQDAEFMVELSNFCDDGTKHFKASFGHDDLVMSEIQLEFVKSTLQYKLLREEFESTVVDETENEYIYNPFENFDEYIRQARMESDSDNYYKRLQSKLH